MATDGAEPSARAESRTCVNFPSPVRTETGTCKDPASPRVHLCLGKRTSARLNSASIRRQLHILHGPATYYACMVLAGNKLKATRNYAARGENPVEAVLSCKALNSSTSTSSCAAP